MLYFDVKSIPDSSRRFWRSTSFSAGPSVRQKIPAFQL